MTRSFWRGVATITLTAVLAAGAHAQDDTTPARAALRRAILTPDAALLPLPTEVVCGPKVDLVAVSPRRNYALIFRRPDLPARDAADFLTRDLEMATAAQGEGPEAQLLLWGPRSRRAVTVWRATSRTKTGTAVVGTLNWLPGTDTAFASVFLVHEQDTEGTPPPADNPNAPRQQVIVLRINAASGLVDKLSDSDPDMRLLVSPYGPLGVLILDSGKKIVTVGAQGAASAPRAIALDAEKNEKATWVGFFDAEHLFGNVYHPGADGKMVNRTMLCNIATGALRESKTRGEQKPPPRTPPPYTVLQDPATLKRGDTPASLTPLWMEGTDPAQGGRALIAPDSDPQLPATALADAVLYGWQGSLFVVPLAKLPLRDFHARRREQDKADTLSHALSIGAAAVGLSVRATKPLPAPGEFVRAVLQNDPTAAQMFQNPATGKPAFTPAYTQTDLSTVKELSQFVIGYLEGPGGRAVIYYGGDTKWEDAPAKP